MEDPFTTDVQAPIVTHRVSLFYIPGPSNRLNPISHLYLIVEYLDETVWIFTSSPPTPRTSLLHFAYTSDSVTFTHVLNDYKCKAGVHKSQTTGRPGH
jgi:hypothetical protein